MYVAAIIVAAGQGRRLGAERPKQFLELAEGRTMLDLSIEAVLASEAVDEVVVAVPAGFQAHVAALPRVTVVEGGARRQDSVTNALGRVSSRADVIVIHDAARPFVSRGLIERTIRAAVDHGAAIAAIAVNDTVKQTGPDRPEESRVVRATLPRETIYLAQTPQAFRRDVLIEAMAAADDSSVTDEATLAERAGFPVQIVEGDPANIKVTTPKDLQDARERLAPRGTGRDAVRIGTGYDLHRLVEGRPLILAGVRIPFERGLLGHSDADIVCHAVTDAVLGAAGAGDIGRLYPDTDAAWKDADSVGLLAAAVRKVHDAGLLVVNVDVTIVAEKPKLAPYLVEMRARLAAALAVDPSRVSVKGKTNEGVDAIGRGEAMACHAVALLEAVHGPRSTVHGRSS